MNEDTPRPKTLTSDPNILRKIKHKQFMRQLIPLIIVAAALVLNVIYPIYWLLYPALAAFAWYLLERMLYRTKNKIPVPQETAFVSPVDGKVQSVHKGQDATLLTIKKSWFDVVEVRLPYPGLQMEQANGWKFETPKGSIDVHIKTSKQEFFNDFSTHGQVIGLMPSNAVFTFYIPVGIKVLVQPKQVVFGGETELFSLAEDAETEEEPPSILVEPIAEEDFK
ncbi:MAG TPA: hypothetical protein PKJ14_07950 [Candidatus Cloacimonadota bacterium]|nr:hypothetical protein [Candidatus Cloacimonadota bacterium]HQL15433.1 hypothetical protein [Candidatus Cloacimonadota bacterium]